jgi:hypothetical protein
MWFFEYLAQVKPPGSEPIPWYNQLHWLANAAGYVIAAIIAAWALLRKQPHPHNAAAGCQTPSATLIYDLFTEPKITAAPYLLACASKICADTGLTGRQKEDAIQELLRKLRLPMDEATYIQQITAKLVKKSVWAACGRKSRTLADNFYEANYATKKAKKHVERIFFPPRTEGERQAVLLVIRKHIEMGIESRLFKNDIGVIQARSHRSFPEGFGMTLIGVCGRSKSDPKTKIAVLIHWGNVEVNADHLGLVLESQVWLDFFWQEFKYVRELTEIANKDESLPIWEKYLHS